MSDLGPVNPGYAADVEWLRRWRLRPEGDPRTTASSLLIRARTAKLGVKAALRTAPEPEAKPAAAVTVAPPTPAKADQFREVTRD